MVKPLFYKQQIHLCTLNSQNEMLIAFVQCTLNKTYLYLVFSSRLNLNKVGDRATHYKS